MSEFVWTINLLDDLSESIYQRLNLTREQQILALTGVLRRVEERSREESAKLAPILKAAEQWSSKIG